MVYQDTHPSRITFSHVMVTFSFKNCEKVVLILVVGTAKHKSFAPSSRVVPQKDNCWPGHVMFSDRVPKNLPFMLNENIISLPLFPIFIYFIGKKYA